MTAWDAIAARREGVPVLMPGPCLARRALVRAIPGLLTLDALAGLQQADVVVHDALVDQRVLALAPKKRGSNSPASVAASRRRCRPTSASG